MNFAFYDLETSGLSPAFDQPLQFAAILTDENFGELDRVDLRCRLAPHILPSPKALAVTGVTPDQLTDPGLPDLFDFSGQIADLIARWTPAVWLGYNTLNFDEHVLRQTFYQNLHPDVYATQFNGNTRFDIFIAAYAAYARGCGLLEVPDDDAGKKVFKLDRLAPANGFGGHNAHDALGDVEATIHVARKIAGGDPELWAGLLDNVKKNNVKRKLESFQPVELVARFGGGEPESRVLCFSGYSKGNANQAALFDIAKADPQELLEVQVDELRKAFYTSKADSNSKDDDGAAPDTAQPDPNGEDNGGATPPRFRRIAINKAPPLFAVDNPDAEHLDRAKAIQEAPEFRERVAEAMSYPAEGGAEATGEPDSPPEPENQIYEGFYSRDDKRRLEEFQRSDWSRRQEMVDDFDDPRLRRLGRRLVSFHAPELLSPEETERLQGYLRGKWSAPDIPETEWMTPGKAKAAIEEMRGEGVLDAGLLDAINDFVDARCG